MPEAALGLDPAHEDALRRLRRMLRAPGGRLVFAVGASHDLQQAVVAALGGQAARIVLGTEEADPWERVVESTAPLALVALPGGPIGPLLQRLNVGRERVQRDGLRVVLWLSQVQALGEVRQSAPDLWAHRAGLLTFLSEADLAVEDVPLPPPLDEQLREVEARIASWPAGDPVGRSTAQAHRVILLAELGEKAAAAAALAQLRAQHRRMRSKERWASAEALNAAAFSVQVDRAPHVDAERARTGLRHPDPARRILAWPKLLEALLELGDLDALARQLAHPPVAGVPDQGLAVVRTNEGSYSSQLALHLGLPRELERCLPLFEQGFAGLETSAQRHQRSRFESRVLSRRAWRAALEGAWMQALELYRSAAKAAEQGKSPAAVDDLGRGAALALAAGLPGVARGWTRRAIELGHRSGAAVAARALVAALDTAVLPEAERDAACALARATLPGVGDHLLAADLLTALGLASDPTEPRRQLQHRLRRHGYDRYAAARGLYALEQGLGRHADAASALSAAFDYAERYGGPALRAELHLQLAEAHRGAGAWEQVAAATEGGRQELHALPPELRPARHLLALARESAALLQHQGEGARADATLDGVVEALRLRGTRVLEHEALVAWCRFGGDRRREAGEAAVALALELGLPALEADALLELAALSLSTDAPDTYALDRATWWITRIGTRRARRRLAQVQAEAGPPLSPS